MSLYSFPSRVLTNLILCIPTLHDFLKLKNVLTVIILYLHIKYTLITSTKLFFLFSFHFGQASTSQSLSPPPNFFSVHSIYLYLFFDHLQFATSLKKMTCPHQANINCLWLSKKVGLMNPFLTHGGMLMVHGFTFIGALSSKKTKQWLWSAAPYLCHPTMNIC